MTIPVEAAGVRVARDLDNAERMANEAILANARLLESMMITRLESEVSLYEGQVAVARVVEAIAEQNAALTSVAKAHKALRADFLKITGRVDEPGRCPTDPLKPTGETTQVA